MTTTRRTFINLAVSDLDRSKRFFEGLGFTFDPRFTDDNAACLVLGGTSYAMLLTKPFFQGFTKRAICDTKTHTEALVALSCDSRAEVDQVVKKAVESGGRHAMDPQDHGFMYGWSFYDPDGHHWEVFWMDEAAAPGGAG